MNSSSKEENVSETTLKATSVSENILEQFFDTLAEDASLSEIAPNLRKVVLDDGVFAEAAIRAVLFPDAP